MRHVERLRALFASGALDADWGQVSDFRDRAGPASLPSDAIRRLARRNPWPPDALRVFVGPRHVLSGLNRMCQLMADPERMHVVASMADARAWMAGRGRPIDAAER